MGIKVRGSPRIFGAGCFLRAEPPIKPGRRLKPEYVMPGRPEIIKNILVVDDDSCFLGIAKDILESLDFNVILINPDKPIKKQVFKHVSNRKRKIDFIIMGGRERKLEISGESLIRELRANGFAGCIAANSLMPEEQEKMVDAGADFKIPERGIRGFFEGAICQVDF